MTDPLARLSAAIAIRYRVERELGHGGMATVYLARDLKHDGNVAITVPGTGADAVLYYVMPVMEGESLRDRLEREERLAPDVCAAIVTEVAGALDHARGQGIFVVRPRAAPPLPLATLRGRDARRSRNRPCRE